MAERTHRVVTAAESAIHDKPHVVDRRSTVRSVPPAIEGPGVSPDRFADRHDPKSPGVYHALAH